MPVILQKTQIIIWIYQENAKTEKLKLFLTSYLPEDFTS